MVEITIANYTETTSINLDKRWYEQTRRTLPRVGGVTPSSLINCRNITINPMIGEQIIYLQAFYRE